MHNDWRKLTHANKVCTEYIDMAHMEMQIIDKYCATMFTDCLALAYICSALASSLSKFYKVKPLEVMNEISSRCEMKMLHQFFYADKILCDSPTDRKAPTVNIVDLKQSQEWAVCAEAMAAEDAALLKKVESFRGCVAMPGSKKMDSSISKLITLLKKVLIFSFIIKIMARHSIHAPGATYKHCSAQSHTGNVG